eukprot:gene1944-17482_t
MSQVRVKINNTPVKIILDTGASIDISDESTFHQVKAAKNIHLSRSTTKLFAYGSEQQLPVLGKFHATIETKDRIALVCPHVVRGNSGSLLSYTTAADLNLIQIRLNAVKTGQSTPATTENLEAKYPKLFDGIGKLKDREIKLHIDSTVPPAAQPARRIPFHLRKKVSETLRDLEYQGIIEKVAETSTPWNAVYEKIRNIEGAVNISDDVIIYGNTQANHDRALHAVCKRFQDIGLTLNKAKCDLNKKEVTFFGYVFSDKGISADPQKVHAIHNAPPPQSVKDIRSFLGMANYCAKFISQFSDISEPLRNLTKKISVSRWTPKERESFDSIKLALTSDKVMAYFDQTKQTELFTDASPTSFFGYFVANYTWPRRQKSRSLRKPIALRCRKKDYDFEIVYKQGAQNPLDFLSRHTFTDTTGKSQSSTADKYVNFLARHAVPKSMDYKEIQDATFADQTLQALIRLIHDNSWNNIRRHQGIVKTKQLLREKIWFPNIDKSVKDVLANCLPCQAIGPENRPAPLHMNELPPKPWHTVHIDHCGPFPTGEYILVVIDAYSRFPEVDIVHSTSASATFAKLDRIFATHGLPHVVKSDNGPPFNSADIKDYMKENGIHFQPITPSHRPDTRIYGYTDLRIHGSTDTRIYGYTDLRIHESTDTRIYGYTDRMMAREADGDVVREMAAEIRQVLKKLRKARGAHRAYVTRTIAIAMERVKNFRTGDKKELLKYKGVLTDKKMVLQKMDEKVLEILSDQSDGDECIQEVEESEAIAMEISEVLLEIEEILEKDTALQHAPVENTSFSGSSLTRK